MLLINSIFKLLHKLRILITFFNTRNKFGAIKISYTFWVLHETLSSNAFNQLYIKQNST